MILRAVITIIVCLCVCSTFAQEDLKRVDSTADTATTSEQFSDSISFEGKTIYVHEIQRRDWDYILYESEDKLNHYVEFVYGKVGVYTKVHKISDEDSEKIMSMSPDQIAVFIKKYRDKK